MNQDYVEAAEELDYLLEQRDMLEHQLAEVSHAITIASEEVDQFDPRLTFLHHVQPGTGYSNKH